jgi:hypothetical protein
MSAAEHPSASQIPEPSDRPAVVGDPDLLADLAWENGYRPGGISDYLTSGMPVLGLRVNSFTDKTIVVIRWQHATFDALGLQYVVENWCSMIWGRPNDVPTPCSYETDRFDPIAKGTRPVAEPHVLLDRRCGWGGILRWGLGYGVDMLVRAKENRMVCIPETFWRPQLEKALEELRAEAVEKGEDVAKVFLTENDILTAWTLRNIVISTNMDPNRTVSRRCLPCAY